MIEQDISHHIQKHILAVLYRQKVARFRDLRKPSVDTNLFSYHLKLLVKGCMVEKTSDGYTLGQKGLAYVDRISEKSMNVRTQPKIVTMMVVQNGNGDILLQKRTKQPYIDTWTLPYGKLHIDDASIAAAATREVYEKLGIENAPVDYAGDCYIRVKIGDNILSTTLVHVFRFTSDDIAETDTIHWARPHKLAQYDLAPAVEQIVARTFFRDPVFFEEFTVEW
ncbi:MAG: NUDIX hydrolase [Candidatus Saccharimonas sp.]